MEFKQSLPGNADNDRKEFLADVSALANRVGTQWQLEFIVARSASERALWTRHNIAH